MFWQQTLHLLFPSLLMPNTSCPLGLSFPSNLPTYGCHMYRKSILLFVGQSLLSFLSGWTICHGTRRFGTERVHTTHYLERVKGNPIHVLHCQSTHLDPDLKGGCLPKSLLCSPKWSCCREKKEEAARTQFTTLINGSHAKFYRPHLLQLCDNIKTSSG